MGSAITAIKPLEAMLWAANKGINPNDMDSSDIQVVSELMSKFKLQSDDGAGSVVSSSSSFQYLSSAYIASCI